MPKRVFRKFSWTVGRNDTQDDTAFYLKNKQVVNTPDAFTISEGESVTLDAHGHAIRALQEVGGRCICDRLLCRDCAQVRCCLDQKSLCFEHWEIIKGRYVCKGVHSWRERLSVAFMERMPDPRSLPKQLPSAKP